MYVVGVLTHHLKHLTSLSCKVACRVLNYLSHHAALPITYMLACTVSDWVSNRDTSGHVCGAHDW